MSACHLLPQPAHFTSRRFWMQSEGLSSELSQDRETRGPPSSRKWAKHDSRIIFYSQGDIA